MERREELWREGGEEEEGVAGEGEREREGRKEGERGRRCVTGDHIFVISATRPLLSCSDVSDCHRTFSIM